MRIRYEWLVIGLLCAGLAVAQNAAPRETVTAMVNGKKVSIEYGRPDLKGRSFDDLLKNLPGDRMWRTGSEQITTLTTETDILIGGKKVPAGKYSLYVHCPETGEYSLAINKVLGQPLGQIWAAAPANMAKEPWPHFNYSKEIADKEVARVAMKKGSAQNASQFKISLDQNAKGAQMNMAWGDRSWTVEIAPAK